MLFLIKVLISFLLKQFIKETNISNYVKQLLLKFMMKVFLSIIIVFQMIYLKFLSE